MDNDRMRDDKRWVMSFRRSFFFQFFPQIPYFLCHREENLHKLQVKALTLILKEQNNNKYI